MRSRKGAGRHRTKLRGPVAFLGRVDGIGRSVTGSFAHVRVVSEPKADALTKPLENVQSKVKRAAVGDETARSKGMDFVRTRL